MPDGNDLVTHLVVLLTLPCLWRIVRPMTTNTSTVKAPFILPILGNRFVTVQMESGRYPYAAVAHCATCDESMRYTQVPEGFAFEHAHRMRHGQYVNGQPIPLHQQRA